MMDLRLEQNQKINILLVSLLISVGFVAFFSHRAGKVRKEAVAKIGQAYKLVERQKDQLEKMVEERTADLKASNDELANFIYRTSHDIRGPLATLKGVCNVALMDIKDKEAINYLEKIDITSSKLINILARIQNINSIKNYVIRHESIELKKFTDDILLKETGKYEEVSVYNDIPADVKIGSDSSMLMMGLSNIINNAFKFRKRSNNKDDERPFVKILFKETPDHNVIQVIDNGAGIQPENLNKIFNLFYKSDPSGNNVDAAGIGLHLAKLAITKIGGTITAGSVHGQNTCFSIKLPKELQEEAIEVEVAPAGFEALGAASVSPKEIRIN
jgi:signal transduction histidine kinase